MQKRTTLVDDSVGMIRPDGRALDQLRTVSISPKTFSHASGSVFFEIGNTKLISAITLQNGVPAFLRSKGSGWLTAEYALLPTATQVRTIRESSSQRRSGRSIEISRLIGRALRSVVNLDVIGEKTIYIDCDVLLADGGTRSAAITSACYALQYAQQQWLKRGIIKRPVLKDEVAAVSVGVKNDTILLDPNYAEDSQIDADFNIIGTKSGRLVEIQGGAETNSVSWKTFDAVRLLAIKGLQKIFSLTGNTESNSETAKSNEKVPLFSIAGRVGKI